MEIDLSDRRSGETYKPEPLTWRVLRDRKVAEERRKLEAALAAPTMVILLVGVAAFFEQFESLLHR